MSERRSVVFGVDGPDDGGSALQWAVREAAAHRVPLRLVHTFRRATHVGRGTVFVDLPKRDEEHYRTLAEAILTEASDRVAEIDPTVELSTIAVDAEPVPALLDESIGALVVVVGGRHLTALGSGLLGSVSAAVAARASCPAVVVHDGAPRDATLPVVVGVDGTDASEALLDFGFGHASLHGAALHAVLCWRPDRLASIEPRSEHPTDERAKAWLAEALAGWQEKFPDVVVSSVVLDSHPTAGLVTASADAQLLVVGTHGRHALAGTLLGSVSQGVLHHATCPVVVVPTHAH